MASSAPAATGMICVACGHAPASGDPYPFRCPRAGEDDGDHVLRRRLDPRAVGGREEAAALFLDPEPNPFLRYRRLFHSYHAALAGGIGEGDWVELARDLDAAVAGVDGRGFRETPLEPSVALSRHLDIGALWVKDETGNVSGSHKARHFMGVALWLEVAGRLGLAGGGPTDPPLAVASCGNAALAAAVVARAAGRRLDVFIPPDAETSVVARLTGLGARLAVCRRQGSAPGDPCYLRFRDALGAGALPFTCQGNENGLIIEGGETLVWEMVSALLRRERRLDHLVVQVGGGALASACIQALEDARALGLVERMPRIHTVQTGGAYPLRRAWDRLAVGIAGEGERLREAAPDPDLEARDRLARRIFAADSAAIGGALREAALHRSRFMWPWEETPRSVARGILDDETYDWLAVVEGMLLTGGLPVVADEETLREARRLAGELAGSPVDATGAAGLAGCILLRRAGIIGPGEEVGVLFTGASR